MRVAVITALAIYLVSAVPGAAAAQQQKIGYVNTDTLLAHMPEYEKVRQQLQVMGEDWKKKLEAMQQEIEQKREEFRKNEILYGDSVRKQMQEEINSLESSRQAFMEEKFGAEGEYFQKQEELLKPIQQKIMDAIRLVAERDNFDFVFDRAERMSVIYGGEEWNLNETVLEELGVNPGDASN